MYYEQNSQTFFYFDVFQNIDKQSRNRSIMYIQTSRFASLSRDAHDVFMFFNFLSQLSRRLVRISRHIMIYTDVYIIYYKYCIVILRAVIKNIYQLSKYKLYRVC